MTKSFTKKFLIEQAELDRLEQRQIRDYSLELQVMGLLLHNIMDIILRKNLSVEELMNMITGLPIRFDKLKNKLKCWAVPYQLRPFPGHYRRHQPCCLKS